MRAANMFAVRFTPTRSRGSIFGCNGQWLASFTTSAPSTPTSISTKSAFAGLSASPKARSTAATGMAARRPEPCGPECRRLCSCRASSAPRSAARCGEPALAASPSNLLSLSLVDKSDVDFFPIVFSTVDGNGRSKVQTMTAQLRNDSQALLHLVTVGAVAAATITVFFGIGFLWLAPPHPVTAPTDPAAPAQVLNAREVPSLSNNDTTLGSSAAPLADNVAVNPTATAPSNPRVLALTSTAPETPIIARVGRTHAKRVRVGRHGHGQTARGWLLGWRSDASAGPNPGGGFYGPPNFNVGYINPK